MTEFVTPASMSAAARHITQEYGAGWVIGIVQVYPSGAVYEARSTGEPADFRIFSSANGEVHRLCDHAPCTADGTTRPLLAGAVLCNSHAAQALGAEIERSRHAGR